MKRARFPEEFKQEAVKQVVERGYSVPDVAGRLGVSAQSLYKWLKDYSPNPVQRYEAELKEVRRENLRLFIFTLRKENYLLCVGHVSSNVSILLKRFDMHVP